MEAHAEVYAALKRALRAGASVRGTTSPNPPVGAVILDADGRVVGTGATQPPGGPHAEIVALREAGARATGGTAVVTLEPCNHTGRTGPCAQARIRAGVAGVYFLHRDPGAAEGGGAQTLRAAGVNVGQLELTPDTFGPDAELPIDGVAHWLRAVERQRPHVTVKFAQTLDGYTAAPDGTSQWITGPKARAAVHEDRAHRDAIIVGTGTALADNPSLTARFPDGSLREHQPRRVVIGTRSIDGAPQSGNLNRLGFVQYPDIDMALRELHAAGCRDVLVEGGAGLIQSFFQRGFVDAVQAYLAPLVLGGGRGVMAGPLGPSLGDAARFTPQRVCRFGPDILWELKRREEG